jgi:hypothetical protein
MAAAAVNISDPPVDIPINGSVLGHYKCPAILPGYQSAA